MKNLNNKENSDFEKSWKDAFEGAELEPSEDVWLKIDGVLANQEAKSFKKTIVYYRYAAAVSLLLLLSTALLSYYLLNTNDNTTQQVANNHANSRDSIVKYDSGNSSISKNNEKNGSIDSSDDSEKSDVIAENTSSGKSKINDKVEDNAKGVLKDESFGGMKGDEKSERKQTNGATINDKNEPARKTDSNRYNYNSNDKANSGNQVLISKNEADDNKAFDSAAENDEGQFTRSLTNYVGLIPLTSKSHEVLAFEREELQHEIYRVPVVPNKKNKKDEDKSSKGYFAGLQFSPGYFDPNIQMNSNALAPSSAFFNSNRSVKYSSPLAPNTDVDVQQQVSYTYGLNFGFKLAKRWLINMGLQYSKNNTSGATSYAFNDNKRYLATPTALNSSSNDAADYTESVNYNLPIMGYQPYLEVYEFTSLPVKAGYVIIDKKLTWIISTGIATDFFLQSKSRDPSGRTDDQLVKSGESSNFRKVFFNGLGSSEVIYNINKNYSISLEPSFRAAISSFSKTESLISSHPKAFGIAAGFRYNF